MFFKAIHTRMKIVLLFIFLLFILIIGKVFYIQVFQYKKLTNMHLVYGVEIYQLKRIEEKYLIEME